MTGYFTFRPTTTIRLETIIGQLRIDTPESIMHAALNAADNQALAIRQDTTYNPVIYTIGLGGTAYQSIDADFLERIANDPRASSYNSTLPRGVYILHCQRARRRFPANRIADPAALELIQHPLAFARGSVIAVGMNLRASL